jgi:hypothetical protein
LADKQDGTMFAYLTINTYPGRNVLFALWSMALFRWPLRRRKHMRFVRLLGSGRSGSFDLRPNWRQWAILHFTDDFRDTPGQGMEKNYLEQLYGRFIAGWWNRFGVSSATICLEVAEGHGSWDGFAPDWSAARPLEPGEPIAVLTRARIRWRKLRDFWTRVGPVSAEMAHAEGLRYSIGIGEAPVYRQATFSIWKNADAMKAFAYRMQAHRDVVRDTRKHGWYAEEMFVRFRVRYITGDLQVAI